MVLLRMGTLVLLAYSVPLLVLEVEAVLLRISTGPTGLPITLVAAVVVVAADFTMLAHLLQVQLLQLAKETLVSPTLLAAVAVVEVEQVEQAVTKLLV
jgi:hypothetical protein